MSFTSRSALFSLAFALSVSTSPLAQTAGAASSPPPAPAPPAKAGAATGPAAKSQAPASTTPAAKATPAPVEVTPASLYVMRAGLSVREMTDAEKKKLGRDGYLVDTVTADSPAAKAGIASDDIVTGIDGASPPSVRELVERIQRAEEGQLFKISLVRAGKDMVVDVRLAGETPEEREKREEEERQKKEAEEKEADEAKEKLDEEREEGEKKAKEEAEKLAEEGKRAGENVEAVVEEDDKFGMLGCCVCSALCPPAAPAFAIAMILVDATPPARERTPELPTSDDTRVTVVRY